jgi:N-acetylmuramoyl-L-alanine amidase
LKGQKQTEYYQEGGLYKYTVGSSSNYNEIYQLRKSLATSFPQAFIIAFKDGKKVNVQEAIQEWRSKKGK